MEQFTTRVLMPNGASVQVFCQAKNHTEANQIFESLYGKDKVQHQSSRA